MVIYVCARILRCMLAKSACQAAQRSFEGYSTGTKKVTAFL